MAASPSPQSSPMPPPQAPSPMGPPQQAPSPSAQNSTQHHAHSPTNYNQGPPPGSMNHMNGPSAMQQGTQTFQQHSVGQPASGQPPVQVDEKEARLSSRQMALPERKSLKRLQTCKFCSQSFTNITRHQKVCPSNPEHQSSNPRSTPCLIEACQQKFPNKTVLIQHLQLVHRNVIDVREPFCKSFETYQDFIQWKEEEEEKTFSYYSKKSGARNNTHYYYCQHDGSKKDHERKKSCRSNIKGRIKVGNICISKIKIIQKEGKPIEMTYYPTHNHILRAENFVHHPLPVALSNVINQQIAEEVSPSKIFKKIQNSYIKKSDQDLKSCKINSILTKRNIRERTRRYKNKKRLDMDDAKAVYLFAQEKKDEDSVILYKPFNGKVIVGPDEINYLPESLFLFGIQTNRQRALMKQFCSKIMVIDETHGTNQYKFKLLTCLVVDDNRRGWPVAHLITNKSDACTLKFFFKILQTRLDGETLNCVITDDDMALINGINEGFQMEVRHLLCQWHVIKNLKDNLRLKVKNKEVYDEMFNELRVIINEKNSNLFQELCNGFITKYENVDSTKTFVSYFIEHYLRNGRPEKWAMSYRNFYHGNVNTTGHIESFHNKLKKVYLKRKVNKRLDDLINYLYDLEWDDHCARERERNHGFLTIPQEVVKKHKSGLEIANEAVKNVLQDTWEIKAKSNENETYVVVKFANKCNIDHCFCKCSACGDLCSHLYTCNCPDRNALCKHIHKVHSFLKRQEEATELFLEIPDTPPPIVSTSDTNKEQGNHQKAKLLATMDINIQKLIEFRSFAETHTLSDFDLKYTNHCVSDIALKLENLKKKTVEIESIEPMEIAQTFHPQEKLKTQVSQISSFKKPKKKNKKFDSLGFEKKKNIKENLLNNIM